MSGDTLPEHAPVLPGQLRQFFTGNAVTHETRYICSAPTRCMLVIDVFPYPDGISDVIIDGHRCTYSTWLIEKWWKVVVDV